jgi:two-component system cell cycle sensor histidine kinase/response regulator CckA
MADLQTSKPTHRKTELAADMRTQLLAEKTELIAEITQVMANEFNNIMMAITGYAELEIKKLPPAERRGLEQIVSNAARATGLVQKLLAISRRNMASPQPLDLNQMLTGISNLLRQLAGERISVVFSLDPSLPAIAVDPAEIEQAILSLAINARNAMTEGGEIKIATQLVELNKDSLEETERPGSYVLLAIDDTDLGGANENPTTESGNIPDQDSRMNLSLAAVRGIVKGAGGWVRFSSKPGEGSSFKIYFPALARSVSDKPERSMPRKLPLARTILIVDDDDAVRIPAAEFLMMEGFKVLQARNGAEAIHVAQQNRTTLDVLITDVVMPKMNGHQVAGKLLELHPDLKVLYMSGDADRNRVARVAGSSQDVTLGKPFRLDTLKDNIHELLGE